MRLVLIAITSCIAGCSVALGYPPPTSEICDNGIDDDLDGLADCTQRSACATSPHCDESTHCADGVDNDRNGLTDCDDRHACATSAACSEAMHCFDTVDNDRNGLTDCDDPLCDGQCPEDTIQRCSDSRDNDGDGYTDFVDARCWPYAHVEIERCPTIQGGAWGAHPTLLDWTTAPPVQAMPDPTNAARTVLGVGEDTGGSLTYAHPTEGGWPGTHVTVEVYLDRAPVFGDVGAASANLRAYGPRGEQWFTWRIDQVEGLSVQSDGDARYETGVSSAGWWTVDTTISVEGSGLALRVVATGPGGSRHDLTVHPMTAWGRSAEVSFSINLTTNNGGGQQSDHGQVLLGDATFARPDAPACDGIARLGTASLFAAGATEGGVTAPSGTCLVTPTGAQFAADTTQGSFAFTADPLGTATPTHWSAVTWDAMRSVFREMGIGIGDDMLVLRESDDCANWRSIGAPFSIAGAPMGEVQAPAWTDMFGYQLWQPRASGPASFELWVGLLTPNQILFATSPTGDAGTFSAERVVAIDPIVGNLVIQGFDGSAAHVDWRGVVSVLAIGNDHVFFVSAYDPLPTGLHAWRTHAFLESPSGGAPFMELGSLLLGPSEIEGADPGTTLGSTRVVFVPTTPRGASTLSGLLLEESFPLPTQLNRVTISAPR
jgi:hypothetical protein